MSDGGVTEARLAEMHVVEKLITEAVEALSERPPAFCKTAYTSRRTHHTVFSITRASLGELVADCINEVRSCRDAQALNLPLLVWRSPPMIERAPAGVPGWKVYLRLCFEEGA